MHALRLESPVSIMKGARRRASIAAIAVALVASGYGLVGPVERANAVTVDQFCWGHPIGPWGECSANFIRPLTMVAGKGGQASACVNAYEWTWLVSSWACAPTNTWAQIYYNGARQLAGAVRNNVNNNNVLYGEMWW